MAVLGTERPTGSAKLKKKIRDAERLLRKPGLAATKKVDAERALTALKSELQDSVEYNRSKKIGRKYHMVRFFEKQKAVRALKKESSGDKELAAFYYTHEFPANEKYSSIFVKDGEPAGLAHPFMKKILEEMENGTRKTGPEAKEAALQQAKAQLRADRKIKK